MAAQILANIGANFKFYRRNRLLVMASLVTLSVLGFSTLPSLFYVTQSRHLTMLITLFTEMNLFIYLVTAGLGLQFISQHLDNRSTKMVFTKPCLPDVWLLSGFLSAALVSLLLHVLNVTLCALLSWTWGLPFQWGMAGVACFNFIKSLILLSYISFLALIIHPSLAVFSVLFFSESMFYYLKLSFMTSAKNAPSSGTWGIAALQFIHKAVDVIYMLLPSLSPFGDRMLRATYTLRMTPSQLKYLPLAFLYAACLCALFHFLSVYALKKKRHI